MTTSVYREIIDPNRGDVWDTLAASHPGNTVFHSSAWARVLVGTYGHKPFYLRLSVGMETIALVPLMEVSSRLTGRRGISLPFSDFAGPLFFGGGAGERVVAELSRIALDRRWRYVEVRGDPSLAPRTLMPTYFGHSLDLTVGTDRILAGAASAVRRNLRRATASGVTTQISRKWEDLLRFYSLHARTRRRHGLPPQPCAFFLNIYEHLLKLGLGFVIVAKLRTRAIAAAVFLRIGRNAVFKFGASDDKFQLHRANNLVMSEAIKHLAEGGAETLHFGRTSVQNEGLRRFKLAWGTTEQTLVYSRFDPQIHSWSSSPPESPGLHNRIFRTLPLPVNRLLGMLCYPHLD